MSRKAVIITLDEFKEKCKKILDEDGVEIDIDKFTTNIDRDLEKVMFDWENHETGIDGQFPQLGYRVLRNNLPVLWCYAGGDWEYPVYFVFYWSGKEMRAYIPEEGNTFDKEYRTAYGSQQETEKFEKLYGHLPYGDPGIPELEDGESGNVKPDFDKMHEDIIQRIEIMK